jgi:uncharacterized membrane-anchored protein YhcB (DUF1043 family)
MSEKVIIGIVAGLAALLGALITSLASAYSSRQKIKEIEIQYQQKLLDTYLTNARSYTNTLYVPLILLLGKLGDAYQQFRKDLDIDTETVSQDSKTIFENACREFDKKLQDLFDKGADAFLTTQLEERLRSFRLFIINSLGANEPIVKTVRKYSLNYAFLPKLGQQEFSSEIRGKKAKMAIVLSGFSFDFLGIGFSYKIADVLASPITSKEFEVRISKDIPLIKYLIKEVTLGKQETKNT